MIGDSAGPFQDLVSFNRKVKFTLDFHPTQRARAVVPRLHTHGGQTQKNRAKAAPPLPKTVWRFQTGDQIMQC